MKGKKKEKPKPPYVWKWLPSSPHADSEEGEKVMKEKEKEEILIEERERIRKTVQEKFARMNIQVGPLQYPLYCFSVMELNELLNPTPIRKGGEG